MFLAAGPTPEAGVNPPLEGRSRQDALLRVTTTRRGSCSRAFGHTSWVVTLHHHKVQVFSGRMLSEGLAWRLVWLMARKLGIEQFLD